MNYGKNQLALLKFLRKWPNKWHRIKRRKAIDAAKGLTKHLVLYSVTNVNKNHTYIYLNLNGIKP